MEISVPCNEEGYIDLQCHLCGEHFKVLAQDINDESNIDIWCRYCGLNGQIFKGLFLTTAEGPGTVWLQTMPVSKLAGLLYMGTAK